MLGIIFANQSTLGTIFACLSGSLPRFSESLPEVSGILLGFL